MDAKELAQKIHELEVKHTLEVRKLKQQYVEDNTEWRPGDTICTSYGNFKVLAVLPFFGAQEISIIYTCRKLNKDHSVMKRKMPFKVFQSDVISGVRFNTNKQK